MKNKILLIKPENKVEADIGTPIPLSLLCLASVLEKEGFEVKIIDAMITKNYLGLIEKELEDSFLVGVTALTSEIGGAIDVLKFVKAKSDIPTVLGGWHPTLFPIQTCSDPLVDFVIVNEGEIALLKLAQALKTGKSYKKIAGLVYKENFAKPTKFSKDNGEVQSNPMEFLNLDELPIPAYHLVNMENYIVTTRRRRWVYYQSSRGCPHNCSFCINKVTNNSRYRVQSPERVIKGLKFLMSKYKANGFVITDDNFFVQRDRAKKVCELMLKEKLNIEWRAECRADYFREGFVDDEILDLATRAGLVELTIGAESGSQKMLEYMHKDITVKDIIHSTKMCKKYGIRQASGFIIGLPTETKDDILLTLKLIKKMLKINPQLISGIGTFRPYPKSPICQDLVRAGQFKEPQTFRDWSKESVIKLYTEGILNQPWQFSPSYIDNVGFFGTRGLLLSVQLNNFKIRRSIDLVFSTIAYLRLMTGFFALPLDKYIFTHYQRLKKKIYNAMVKR